MMEDRPLVSDCHLGVIFPAPELMTLPQISEVAEWLGPAERLELELWRSPERRLDWLRGRWLAKTMLRRWLPVDSVGPRDIEILSRNPMTGRGIAPRVRIRGEILARSLSLAHTEGSVAIALAKNARIQVGIDLVRRQSATPGFERTWFTEHEQQHFAFADPAEPIRFWAAKEALFKAISEEHFIPKQWELTRRSPDVLECQSLISHGSEPMQVRTWQEGDFIVALAIERVCP